MMAAILNSAMLDSDTLYSSLRFTQKTLSLHSESNQFNVVNLMMAPILNSAIFDTAILQKKSLTQTYSIWL